MTNEQIAERLKDRRDYLLMLKAKHDLLARKIAEVHGQIVELEKQA